METQYARFDELKEAQPEIAEKLMQSPLYPKNPIREAWIGPYVYGLWKSGYVRRRLFSIWLYQKWKTIPMEKVKNENHNQTRLLEVEKEKTKVERD